jgi:hypothetical protein
VRNQGGHFEANIQHGGTENFTEARSKDDNLSVPPCVLRVSVLSCLSELLSWFRNRVQMYRQAILSLIEACKEDRRAGTPPDEILNRALAERVALLMNEVAPGDLLEWLKEDREYSYYYYDAEQSGACAKPREAAALILESIVRDAIEYIRERENDYEINLRD